MSTADFVRVPPDWLALREGADAAARATSLLDPLRPSFTGPLVVRDLGCGTGSQARWLAGLLPAPTRWVLHDRDPDLVALAAAGVPGDVTTVVGDVTRLRAADLLGTTLVTASALLDLLTAAEVDDIAAACVGAACPALLALTVAGRVELLPGDPLDAEFEAAFNEHQRRTVAGRALLGPTAADVTAAAFERRGATVRSAPSPWRLGPDQADLTAEWLRGWVGAAVEQRPDLAGPAVGYLARRLAAGVRAVVWHTDLLALPGGWL
jgi:SAM-dependent methyltransferase